MTTFPYFRHRTLAEVAETEELRLAYAERRIKRHQQIRLVVLEGWEQCNNPEPSGGNVDESA